jgi:DNA-binding NtrC family response regulator
MAAMTGEALAQEARRLRPDLPIILCSGSRPTMTQEQVEAMGIQAFLMKPVMRQELGIATRQVLDRQSA